MQKQIQPEPELSICTSDLVKSINEYTVCEFQKLTIMTHMTDDLFPLLHFMNKPLL